MLRNLRLSVVLLTAGFLGTRLLAIDPATQPLRVAGDRPADIRHIKIEASVDIPKKFFGGTATIDLVALRDLKSIKFDAVDFAVTNVLFARGEGRASPIEYINDGESIEVLIGDTVLTTGTPATITIEYSITDPSSGLHYFGPTEVDPDTPYVVWSQGESVTNRHWVPCFDHPNEMQTTELVITVEAGNEVVSNGRLVSKKTHSDQSVTYHWLQDKPHVSYLMTLVVGEFHVEQETWRGKPILYYVPKDHRDDVKRSFSNTLRMLSYFSDLTGVEYPWDKYAQICAEGFGGGMENTSATTLGTSTLHDARAHLDSSSDGLVAHELAHQWFGDLVTCKDWSHLWLNEGFASFLGPMWTEHDLGKDEYDYAIYRSMQRAIRGGKDRPVLDRHYEHSGDMFDSRAYPKGASILHMLRRRLGDELFWRSVNHYLTQHAHQPVETSDFRKALEKTTGQSLERFFHDWVKRPGAPMVEVNYSWDEEQKLAEVSVKQTQEADAFYFPLEIEFHFDEHDSKTVRREVTKKDSRFLFVLPKHPTMMLVDPHDAVLMELKEEKGLDLWKQQLTKAPYATSRIRAANHFGDSGKDSDVAVLAEALQSEPFWGVGEKIAGALGEAGGDAARDALLQGLRHAHPKVRRPCASKLDAYLGEEKVISALYALIQKGDPSYRVEAAAIRSYGKLQPEGAASFLASLMDRDSHREQLRSAALSALGELADASGLPTLLEWNKPKRPRACRMAAMRAMGTLAENLELSDEDLAMIVDSITAQLRDEHRWVKGTGIRTLKNLGEAAKSAIPILRAVEAHDGNRRIQKAAKTAIETINSAKPKEQQLTDLREDLDELREENESLLKRIEKLEAHE